MATTKTPAAPAVKLTALPDDAYDLISLKGGKGRPAKPSAQLDTVREALKLMPKDGYAADSRDGWYMLKATTANTNDVNARELRKAAKQLNEDRADADKIKVEVRPRDNHPELGSFVAWRVNAAPVTVAETPGDSATA